MPQRPANVHLALTNGEELQLVTEGGKGVKAQVGFESCVKQARKVWEQVGSATLLVKGKAGQKELMAATKSANVTSMMLDQINLCKHMDDGEQATGSAANSRRFKAAQQLTDINALATVCMPHNKSASKPSTPACHLAEDDLPRICCERKRGSPSRQGC